MFQVPFIASDSSSAEAAEMQRVGDSLDQLHATQLPYFLQRTYEACLYDYALCAFLAWLTSLGVVRYHNLLLSVPLS